MREISPEQLKHMKQSGENFAFFNVLAEEYFREAHIPGSENVPADQNGFIEAVEQRVKDKETPIVVYCADEQCQASRHAAKQLEEAGFERVLDMTGGTASWRNAGYEVVGA